MKKAYKTIVVIVAIITAAFIVSCDQKPSNSNRGADPVVEPPPTSTEPPHVENPSPPEPRRVETSLPSSSFSDVMMDPFSKTMINKHEMLSPAASKEWLRENNWEVTSQSDNQIIIQRNYKSGNRSDETEVSLGSKGQRGVSVKNNILFTVDDNDNIRVGIQKSESD